MKKKKFVSKCLEHVSVRTQVYPYCGSNKSNYEVMSKGYYLPNEDLKYLLKKLEVEHGLSLSLLFIISDFFCKSCEQIVHLSPSKYSSFSGNIQQYRDIKSRVRILVDEED